MEGFLAYMGKAWPMAVCVLGFQQETAPSIRYFIILIMECMFHSRGFFITEIFICNFIVASYRIELFIFIYNKSMSQLCVGGNNYLRPPLTGSSSSLICHLFHHVIVQFIVISSDISFHHHTYVWFFT